MKHNLSKLKCEFVKWVLRKTRYIVSQIALFGFGMVLGKRSTLNYERYLKVEQFYNTYNIYSKCK